MLFQIRVQSTLIVNIPSTMATSSSLCAGKTPLGKLPGRIKVLFAMLPFLSPSAQGTLVLPLRWRGGDAVPRNLAAAASEATQHSWLLSYSPMGTYVDHEKGRKPPSSMSRQLGKRVGPVPLQNSVPNPVLHFITQKYREQPKTGWYIKWLRGQPRPPPEHRGPAQHRPMSRPLSITSSIT